MAELAWRFRAAVAAHPAAIPLLLAHYQYAPGALHWSESLLGVLAEAGLSGRQRVIAVRSLTAYTIGALLNEFGAALTQTVSTVLGQLSPDQYPNIISASRHAGTVTPQQEFGQGLEMFLAGLAAWQAGPRPAQGLGNRFGDAATLES